MDGLFTLIIIIAIVMKVVKKSEKSQKKQSRPQQYQQYQQRQNNANQQRPMSQSELKTRLQQKCGQKPAEKTDILTRAKQNAAEEDEDVIAHVMHDETHVTECKAPEVRMDSVADFQVEESNILGHVNDLIVKGYSGDMEFERDFIAEGVEMLNRFTL